MIITGVKCGVEMWIFSHLYLYLYLSSIYLYLYPYLHQYLWLSMSMPMSTYVYVFCSTYMQMKICIWYGSNRYFCLHIGAEIHTAV